MEAVLIQICTVIIKVELLHLCSYKRQNTHKRQGNCVQMGLELFLRI